MFRSLFPLSLFCFAALTPLPTPTAYAQDTPPGGGPPLLRALQSLDLSEAQRGKLRDLLRTARRDSGGGTSPAPARMRQLRADIEALLTPQQRQKLRSALNPSAPAAPKGEVAAPLVAEGTPEEVARSKAADAYAARKAGLSLAIYKDGKLVYEAYHNGFTPTSAHQLASASKSFWGVAAAAAVQDGFLSLEEKASDTLTEWKGDAKREQITVRHLLSFTSGLKSAGGLFAKPEVNDRYAFAVAQPAVAAPGTTYQYDDVHLYAFGELLKRKLRARAKPGETAEDPLAYLKRRILDPIGLSYSRWARDRAGNPALPYGAILTAREWGKFGEFLRQGGKWNGKPLVSEAALKECFIGSKANAAYGLTFWLNTPPTPGAVGSAAADGPAPGRRRLGAGDVSAISAGGIYAGAGPDAYMAAGAGQQRLYVLPSKGYVIVRQANRSLNGAMMGGGGRMDRSFTDAEFLALLLGDRK